MTGYIPREKYPFESDDEYQHVIIIDKRDAGYPLTKEEEEMISYKNPNTLTYSEEEISAVMEKWQDGSDLTDEEEQMIVDIINDGDPMMGATT